MGILMRCSHQYIQYILMYIIYSFIFFHTYVCMCMHVHIPITFATFLILDFGTPGEWNLVLLSSSLVLVNFTPEHRLRSDPPEIKLSTWNRYHHDPSSRKRNIFISDIKSEFGSSNWEISLLFYGDFVTYSSKLIELRREYWIRWWCWFLSQRVCVQTAWDSRWRGLRFPRTKSQPFLGTYVSPSLHFVHLLTAFSIYPPKNVDLNHFHLCKTLSLLKNRSVCILGTSKPAIVYSFLWNLLDAGRRLLFCFSPTTAN